MHPASTSPAWPGPARSRGQTGSVRLLYNIDLAQSQHRCNTNQTHSCQRCVPQQCGLKVPASYT
jgi:hypothetical protein